MTIGDLTLVRNDHGRRTWVASSLLSAHLLRGLIRARLRDGRAHLLPEWAKRMIDDVARGKVKKADVDKITRGAA